MLTLWATILPVLGGISGVWFLVSLVRAPFKKWRRSGLRQMLLAGVVFVSSSYANHYLYLAFGFASPNDLKQAVNAQEAKNAVDEANAKELAKAAKIVADCSDKLSSFTMSQEFVRRALKAPSTATFPGMRDPGVNISVRPNCAFRVIGWVDAQNSFGAQIRSIYVVEMSLDTKTDTWHQTDIAIKGR